MENCKTEKYTYKENSATLSLSSDFQIEMFKLACASDFTLLSR